MPYYYRVLYEKVINEETWFNGGKKFYRDRTFIYLSVAQLETRVALQHFCVHGSRLMPSEDCVRFTKNKSQSVTPFSGWTYRSSREATQWMEELDTQSPDVAQYVTGVDGSLHQITWNWHELRTSSVNYRREDLVLPQNGHNKWVGLSVPSYMLHRWMVDEDARVTPVFPSSVCWDIQYGRDQHDCGDRWLYGSGPTRLNKCIPICFAAFSKGIVEGQFDNPVPTRGPIYAIEEVTRIAVVQHQAVLECAEKDGRGVLVTALRNDGLVPCLDYAEAWCWLYGEHFPPFMVLLNEGSVGKMQVAHQVLFNHHQGLTRGAAVEIGMVSIHKVYASDSHATWLTKWPEVMVTPALIDAAWGSPVPCVKEAAVLEGLVHQFGDCQFGGAIYPHRSIFEIVGPLRSRGSSWRLTDGKVITNKCAPIALAAASRNEGTTGQLLSLAAVQEYGVLLLARVNNMGRLARQIEEQELVDIHCYAELWLALEFAGSMKYLWIRNEENNPLYTVKASPVDPRFAGEIWDVLDFSRHFRWAVGARDMMHERPELRGLVINNDHVYFERIVHSRGQQNSMNPYMSFDSWWGEAVMPVECMWIVPGGMIIVSGELKRNTDIFIAMTLALEPELYHWDNVHTKAAELYHGVFDHVLWHDNVLYEHLAMEEYISLALPALIEIILDSQGSHLAVTLERWTDTGKGKTELVTSGQFLGGFVSDSPGVRCPELVVMDFYL